jgi:antitoxin VapB
MGVQLNIKDAETVRLARELAGRRGVSVTQAIREALENDARAREDDFRRRLAEVDAIVAEMREHLDPAWRGRSSKEIMDSIYDEDGLPV